MKTGILIIIFLAINLIVKAQQDPQFSQNMFNHMTVNPAFAGLQNKWVISGIYRNQWQSMPDAPETYALNVDAPLRIVGWDGGFGLNVLKDKLGLQSALQIMLNYSFKQTFRWGVWSVGIKVGMVNEKIGADWYIPESGEHKPAVDDPALNQEDVSKILFDMGAGTFLNGENFYTGLAVSHLTKPRFTVGQSGEFFLTPHLYWTGGYAIRLTPVWDIQPSAFLVTDFVSVQYTLNANAVYKKRLWGGVSYRWEDAVVFMGGVMFRNLAMGYSYDWSVSEVGKYTGGSHEVTLSYCFGQQGEKRRKIYKSVRFL